MTTLMASEFVAPNEPRELRRAFGAFPSGVVAVAGVGVVGPVGLAASSFTSVSMEPPLVSVCIARSSATWPLLRKLPRLGVSIFSDGQAPACRQLGMKAGDRFAGLDWHSSADGALFLGGASAWFDCSVEDVLVGGDHDIVLLRVVGMSSHERSPLVFQGSRFHRLLTSPDN